MSVSMYRLCIHISFPIHTRKNLHVHKCPMEASASVDCLFPHCTASYIFPGLCDPFFCPFPSCPRTFFLHRTIIPHTNLPVIAFKYLSECPINIPPTVHVPSSLSSYLSCNPLRTRSLNHFFPRSIPSPQFSIASDHVYGHVFVVCVSLYFAAMYIRLPLGFVVVHVFSCSSSDWSRFPWNIKVWNEILSYSRLVVKSRDDIYVIRRDGSVYASYTHRRVHLSIMYLVRVRLYVFYGRKEIGRNSRRARAHSIFFFSRFHRYYRGTWGKMDTWGKADS